MMHHPQGGMAAGGVHLPAFGRGADEHRAGAGTRLAQAHPISDGGVGAAGGLLHAVGGVVFRVRRRGLHADLVQADFQLLGDDRGRAGPDTLAELGIRHDQGDAVVGQDADEGAGWGGRWRRWGGQGGAAADRHWKAEQEPAGGEQAELEDIAAMLGHGDQASAASWMAARMRV
jgi:hypothetical protein